MAYFGGGPPESPAAMRFFGQSRSYRFRGRCISMSGPPEFPAPCAINFAKSRILTAPPDHLGLPGQKEACNFGRNRQIPGDAGGGGSGPLAIAIVIFRRLDRPSSRRHVRFLAHTNPIDFADVIFWWRGRPCFRPVCGFCGKPAPYRFRGRCISKSGRPEFLTPRAINFPKWQIPLAISDHLCHQRKQKTVIFGRGRQISPFRGNSGLLDIEIGVFRRLDRLSSRRHVGFSGESGPYSFRGWGIFDVGTARVSEVARA